MSSQIQMHAEQYNDAPHIHVVCAALLCLVSKHRLGAAIDSPIVTTQTAVVCVAVAKAVDLARRVQHSVDPMYHKYILMMSDAGLRQTLADAPQAVPC
jgi:hypothetical protein